MAYPLISLHPAALPLACLLFALGLMAVPGVQAADAAAAAKTDQTAPISVSRTETAPPVSVVVNKSMILRLEVPATRISVASPAVADITPINSREIYVLGKSIGSTNLIIWNKSGVATMMDVKVTAEPAPATSALAAGEKDTVEVIKGLNRSEVEFNK